MLFNVFKRATIWFILLLLTIHTKRPSNKRQLSVWQLECELGTIADPDCPIDGGWSPWSSWSPCQGPCDDVGHRHRTRECTNPSPSQEGLPCNGQDEQSEVCYLTNCTVNDYRTLIYGDFARMKALHHLEAVPALMERCLEMECPFEAIEAALNFDNTWQLNAESLWNALQCVKRNLGCPKIGEWGAWSPWSICGSRCGRGFRWRLRRCDTPPPSDANLVCTGTPLQADECIGDQCAISSQNSEGSWSEWGAWSTCTENCGPGVRRRKRVCYETNTPQASGTWGTHCRGQCEQVEVCENTACDLDGGWAGWGGWGPCSQTCGAGKRSRTRSCTRPIPAGKGKSCVGSRTEVGSCHMTPCEGYSHTVALFHGESSLHYDLTKKRSMLYHFYMRFMPLSPNGNLVRRRAGDGSFVRLSMQKWHVCLDACDTGRSCCLPRSCSHATIEPAVWHTALITVTNIGANLRLDDAPVSIRSIWSCHTNLPDDKLHIYVGEKFQGQMQELILNFIPLKLTVNRNQRQSDFYPATASNIAYEKGSTTEAYLRIKNDHFLRLPCYENQDQWKLELTLKPKRESGTILFLKNEKADNWLHLELQNMRLKLRLALGGFRTESSSTTECPPDAWLDVTLTKEQGTNSVEASINAGERLHVLFEEAVKRLRRLDFATKPDTAEDHQKTTDMSLITSQVFAFCTDEFFIGGIPHEIKHRIALKDFVPFSGILASVKVNKVPLDLHDYSLERYKDNKVQFSSRTASVSGSYHETAWGRSNLLNLTCLHGRSSRTPHSARWLFLDTTVMDVLSEKTIRSIDDGRVLKLVASADNDLRGFYTCRAHSNRHTRNIVTYGVLGKVQYKLHGPDMTTAIAVFTTLTIVLGTLVWLFIEGVHDIRNGYGFFRDAHLTPLQEAEEVCRCIDQNIHMISSKSGAMIAKARVRRRMRELAASRSNFAAQEPEGLMEEDELEGEKIQCVVSEPEILPVVEEVKSLSNREAHTHEAYRFEPCYISSPRHGTLTSPNTGVTSSSSFELISPRFLCSKLLLTRSSRSSRDSKSSRKKEGRRASRNGSYLTMSSHYTTLTTAQKVLYKFRQLKSDD